MAVYGVYLALIVIFVALDQLSKQAVVSTIPLGEKIVLISDFFNLTYVRNFGAGFSILQNATFFLSAISIIAIIILSYELIRNDRKDLLSNISYILIISGAIGNLIDRLRLGYVVDFLDFKIFSYDYPVFNVADSFITVGCFLLILKVFLESKNAKDQHQS